MNQMQETRLLVIKSLIPTAAYASLGSNAKIKLIDTAEMFVDYIFNGKPIDEGTEPESIAPVKAKRIRKKTAAAPL